jgi:hypothetical protein
MQWRVNDPPCDLVHVVGRIIDPPQCRRQYFQLKVTAALRGAA